ncbi:hypothetical protein [Burkholderia sp. F1]|uniref:hypothetical protein n=1 Tax=Burkholderia sp. F1 TaxID=3366817 RepID=UPI003D7391BE
MSAVRNGLAVTLFAVADFWLTGAQGMAFFNLGHPNLKLAMVCALFAITAVFLAAGAFTGTFRPRARGAGVALLVASGMTALAAIGVASLLLSPDFVALAGQHGARLSASMFSVAPGLVATALPALAGAWLVRRR